jgi:hypothetical protein
MLATETAHERCRTEPFSCPTELDMYCTAWGSLAELTAAVSAAIRAEAAAEAADPAVQQEWREWRALEAALVRAWGLQRFSQKTR